MGVERTLKAADVSSRARTSKKNFYCDKMHIMKVAILTIFKRAVLCDGEPHMVVQPAPPSSPEQLPERRL